MKNALSSDTEVRVSCLCGLVITVLFVTHFADFYFAFYKDDGTSEEARKAQELSDLLREKEKLLEVEAFSVVIRAIGQPRR